MKKQQKDPIEIRKIAKIGHGPKKQYNSAGLFLSDLKWKTLAIFWYVDLEFNFQHEDWIRFLSWGK